MTELHDLTALEQGEAVRTGEVSPGELVEHYVERIERLDPELGAFVTRTFEAARAQAGEALPDGPLAGVPIGVKDLNLTEGVPTAFGSAVFAGFVPPISDSVVERMRAAGTISLGKTATPEFGLPCYTETAVGPPTRNPWDTSRSAGGSSGGAGAAVAAGLLPIAQGSDGGGSLRIPGSVNGLVGLKPSRGRVSNAPVVADITGLPTNGPLARTVRDAAALLDVLAGPVLGDPWPAPAQEGTFLSACDAPPGRLRVGRTTSSPVPGFEVHPEVRRAYEDASAVLESLGHEVEDLPEPPYGPELLPAFEVLWSVSAAGAPVGPDDEHRLLPLTRWLRERGQATSAVQFTGALAAVQAAARQAVTATAAYDVLLLPTVAQLPAPLGWFTAAGDPAGDFERQKVWTPFTAQFNVSGQPAVSLPLGMSESGLPIGIMLVGRPAGEAALLSLAAQVESARPWAHRHPGCW